MTFRGWLVVDLDGTIIDIRPRHYAAHLRVTKELGLPPLASSAYWRNKRSARSLGARYQDRRGDYDQRFLDVIEVAALIRLDQPFPHAVNWLAHAQQSGLRVVIATNRRYSARARIQVRELGLPRDLLVISSGSKSGAVAAAVDSTPVAWVGDTEADIESARELGTMAIAVTSGLRCKSVLTRYRPDMVLSRLDQLRTPLTRQRL